MVITRRNKVLALLAILIVVFYYAAKYYNKIQTKNKYEEAIVKCSCSKVEGLYVKFNNFYKAELKNGFLLIISDSTGRVYYKNKEIFFTDYTMGEPTYVTFDLKRDFKQSDTLKILIKNRIFVLNDFLLEPSMVRANMISVFGNGMKPYGCNLKTLKINGLKTEINDASNNITITK